MKKIVARFSFEENAARINSVRGMDGYEYNATYHTWDVYKEVPDEPKPSFQAQPYYDEKVEYVVYGESPNTYEEGGVTKRTYSVTGAWDNADAAQKAADEMGRAPEDRLYDPWNYRVVKRVTVHSVKYFEVYEGV